MTCSVFVELPSCLHRSIGSSASLALWLAGGLCGALLKLVSCFPREKTPMEPIAMHDWCPSSVTRLNSESQRTCNLNACRDRKGTVPRIGQSSAMRLGLLFQLLSINSSYKQDRLFGWIQAPRQIRHGIEIAAEQSPASRIFQFCLIPSSFGRVFLHR